MIESSRLIWVTTFRIFRKYLCEVADSLVDKMIGVVMLSEMEIIVMDIPLMTCESAKPLSNHFWRTVPIMDVVFVFVTDIDMSVIGNVNDLVLLMAASEFTSSSP